MKKRCVLYLFFLVSIGAAVYSNALRNGFVWDDRVLILENQYLRSFANLPQAFTSDLMKFNVLKLNFYRPLQTVAYMWDYHFWLLDPFGYHLTSVFLHLACAVSVFFLALFLSRDAFLSFFSALIFMVNPVQTEAVTYASGRADILVTLFLVGSVLAAFLSCEGASLSGKWFALSLFCFIGGLLSKEAAIVLPFLVAVLVPKMKKIHLTPFFIVLGVYAVLRATLLNFGRDELVIIKSPFFSNLLTAPKLLWAYLGTFFFPVNVHLEKKVSYLHSPLDPVFLVSTAFLILLIFTAFKRRRDKELIFCLLWFLITILPVLNFVPLNSEFADHWLYLPSVGLSMLLPFLVGKASFLDFKRRKIAGAILCSALVFFYAGKTMAQNRFYENDLILYQDILKYNPDSVRAHFNLGYLYWVDKKDAENAIREYEETLRLSPSLAPAYNNLGGIYLEQNRLIEAARCFEKALTFNPSLFEAKANLGFIFQRLKKPGKALEWFQKAEAQNPRSAEVKFFIASLHFNEGRYDEALKKFGEVLELKPGPALKEQTEAQIRKAEKLSGDAAKNST